MPLAEQRPDWPACDSCAVELSERVFRRTIELLRKFHFLWRWTLTAPRSKQAAKNADSEKVSAGRNRKSVRWIIFAGGDYNQALARGGTRRGENSREIRSGERVVGADASSGSERYSRQLDRA
jgi:hypothetical protein